MDIYQTLEHIVIGNDLNANEAEQLFTCFMDGEIEPPIMAAYLVALRMKGVTAEEVATFAKIMRSKALKVSLEREVIVDTCGTGADCLSTFNISTTAAFVVAAAGHTVAKHGNRSVSSKSGSADVLEALGIPIGLTHAQIQSCIANTGMGFMFAPVFHTAMSNVAPVRRALKISTVFNILGPLTNPANANVQLLGVFEPQLTELMAGSLKIMGCKAAYVVHGEEDGLDEISVCGPTRVTQLRNDGTIRTFCVVPEDFGIRRSKVEELFGGSPQENAHIIRQILDNELKGPKTQAVLINAGFAIAAVEDITPAEGIEKSRVLIENGSALKILNALCEFGRSQT